jgi:hypothetical protein
MRGLLVLLGLLSGCSSPPVQYAFLNPPPRRLVPRAWHQVEVFSGSQPPRSFVQIGSLDAPDGFDNFTDAELIRMAREEAGRRGCDAVVLTPIASTSSLTTAFGRRSFITTESTSVHGFHGACIVYRD